MQRIDLGDLDARDPEGAELERAMLGRDDIDVSDDDSNELRDDEPEERQPFYPREK